METRWEERRGSRKTVEVGRGGVWTGSSLRLLNVWTGKRTSQMVEKVTERGGEVCAWIDLLQTSCVTLSKSFPSLGLGFPI